MGREIEEATGLLIGECCVTCSYYQRDDDWPNDKVSHECVHWSSILKDIYEKCEAWYVRT